ncbi:MAG: hypothetical protein GC178_14310 [Flavobacteriales bacterium]|nr:hypothetical protein [Flavobacteriales bacterium]
MKKLLLSFTIALFCFHSNAQISLISTDLTSIGDNILRYIDTIPTYGPGGAGANQTWDFSSAVNDTLNNTSVVSVGSTPYSSTFSGSTYAMTNDNNSFLYFTHNTNTMETTGAAGDLLGTGEIIEAPFSDALTLHQFPRTYGSNFDDTYAFQAEADGSAFNVYRVRLTHSGHVYDTTDAYGTLITPTGTYDALRVKSTDYTTNVIEVQISQFVPVWTNFATTQDTSVSYSWHAKEEMLAIAEYSYDSIGNPKQFVYSTVPPVTTVGVDENASNDFSIYPQPASDRLCMKGLPQSRAGMNVEIYSVAGGLVRKEYMTDNCMDVSDLRSGMYVLRAMTSEGVLQKPMKFSVVR